MLDLETIRHIQNTLRRGTLTWHGREECFRRASKQVWEGKRRKKACKKTGKAKGSKIYKLHWQCAKCREWKRDKTEFECDHIFEVGNIKLTTENFEKEVAKFIRGMYCGQDNLQILCIACHLVKSSGFNSSLKHKRKK